MFNFGWINLVKIWRSLKKTLLLSASLIESSVSPFPFLPSSFLISIARTSSVLSVTLFSLMIFYSRLSFLFTSLSPSINKLSEKENYRKRTNNKLSFKMRDVLRLGWASMQLYMHSSSRHSKKHKHASNFKLDNGFDTKVAILIILQ